MDLLSKEDILKSIEEEDSLEIISSKKTNLLLWDNEDAKEIPVHFLEYTNPSVLAKKIHISKDIPDEYQIDKKTLSEYLWTACDRNAFITLDEIVVIWSEPDDPDTFEPSDFIDSESKRLYKKYYDEYAYEIGTDPNLLGQLWYERNTVMVNMGTVVRTAKEAEKANSDLMDSFFSFENQFQVCFLTTVLHELRHLQMETNIFLPEDEYPLYLNAENKVEDYAIDTFENNPFNTNIFCGLYPKAKETLVSKIHAADEKAASFSANILNKKPVR